MVYDSKSQVLVNRNSHIRTILRNKSFIFALGGRLTDGIAFVFAGVAFSYLIYDVTENASLMALMGFVGNLPTVFFIIFAGVIVDRYDQRKLILLSIILRFMAIMIFLLCFIFRGYLIQENYINFIWPMYTAHFIASIALLLRVVSERAYTKYIINKEEYLTVNSLTTIIMQFFGVLTPFLAGLLITQSYLYSFITAVCIMSLAVILSSILVYKGMKTPTIRMENKHASKFRENVKLIFKDIKIGLDAIKSEPKILFLTWIFVATNFTGVSRFSMRRVILQGEMGLSATWMGIISAVTGLISIITAYVIMKLKKMDRKIIVVFIAFLLETAGIFLFSFNRNPWIMVSINVVPFGIVAGMVNIPFQTLRQEKIPHEKLGRVVSSIKLFIGIGNLIAYGIVTWISTYIKPMYIVLTGGILNVSLLSVCLIVYLSRDELRISDYAD